MRINDCNTCYGFTADRALEASLPTLVAEMRQHGVAEAWTYSLRSLHLADEGNTETLNVTGQHRFLTAVAAIDPHQPTVLEEIARCLRAGIRLYRFFPAEHRW